ncbi:MAG: adenylyl-sulfate kinase [Clostridium sp. 42_12]|nr:MAG: adenylyl-sulfate kinase [Clostridium sp. 42_12]
MQSLLKFITCGSVDDGKSTLIGHMLYDAKLLFADQKRALELDSRVGSTEGQIDYSLLLDGLMAEREQGITIDVAYRYFTTKERAFIVADTPGHEEYTRNMAVGASFADLAVILIDATKGVLSQTKRHTRICAMMGIRSVVYAINKMDLVDYSEARFNEIKNEIEELAKELQLANIKVIPVSATEGDNVTKKSEHTPWYDGEALLEYLEDVDVEEKEEKSFYMFVMPVQRVCRPNKDFRGFAGQIEVGELSVGDEIRTLPSGETAKVTQIFNTDRSVEHAIKGQAVTICLDREVDVSRGCMLYRNASLQVGHMFIGKLLWMDDKPLIAGRNYLLKVGTKSVPAVVMKIRAKIEVNEGNEVPADKIFKNEMAVCEINCQEKIVYDLFAHHKELGGFILIDRVSHMTSACGTIEQRLQREDHVVWQKMDITPQYRAEHMNQKPKTIWLTGLSGAGKSTIANALEKRLAAEGRFTMTLDGDNVRMGLNQDLGFEEKDRIENIRRVSEVAKLMNDAGLIVLVSFISPFREERRKAREIIGEPFVEVYVSTSLEECERRDVKGLYKKARSGEIAEFSGISSPYEPPEHPDIIVDTTNRSVEEVVDELWEFCQ